MVKPAAAARAIDLDPIDRLEEKVRRLVQLIAQLRAEQARAAGDNARRSSNITYNPAGSNSRSTSNARRSSTASPPRRPHSQSCASATRNRRRGVGASLR